ncbi:MAG: hypothetical protein QXT92_00020 [Nitrososphaerota archaeon]
MSEKEICFVNMTPHEVTIYDQQGKNVIMKIPPSGQVARVSTFQQKIGEINGVPVSSGKIVGTKAFIVL